MKLAMNRAMWAVSACLILASGLFAQPAPKVSAKPSGATLGADSEMIRGLLSKLDLTEDQKKQVEGILNKTREDASSDFDRNKQKLEELSKQMQAAQGAKDSARIKDLCDQMVKLMPDTDRSFRDQLKGILTEEQNKKLDVLLNARKGMTFSPTFMAEMALVNADSVGLTDQQKTRLDNALTAMQTELKAIEAERSKAAARANEQLMNEVEAVLTADQHGLVKNFCNEGTDTRVERVLKDLNLTEAQRKQADGILQSRSNPDKPGEMRNLNKQQIQDLRGLLTPVQQAKFDQVVDGRRPGAGEKPDNDAKLAAPLAPAKPGKPSTPATPDKPTDLVLPPL